MKMTEIPFSRARAIKRSTFALCRTPSAAVGSSRINTRAPKWIARAIDLEDPFAGAVTAGEDLDQRGLAGAVVAEQAMHLAAPQPHRHVSQSDDAAEVLGDVLELEDVLGLGIRRHRYLASVTRLRTW